MKKIALKKHGYYSRVQKKRKQKIRRQKIKALLAILILAMLAIFIHKTTIPSERTYVITNQFNNISSKAILERTEDKIEIPVCHSSSVKSYMDYRAITSTSSKQWQYIHKSGNIEIKNGYLMENEYVGVALGSYFGEIGSKYIFTLDTGKQIKVVKVEEKADKHTNNGCEQKWDKSVIEFVVDSKNLQEYKASNGYIYQGNFNNAEQFNGKIVKIEQVVNFVK